jgi:flagellar biosynthesis protein FlhF
MQVKRIVASNMRLALQAVRDQLGADAIILSNKRIDQGIELMCTLDSEAAVKDSSVKTGAAPHIASTIAKQSEPSILEKSLSLQNESMRRKAEEIEQRLKFKSKAKSAADVYELKESVESAPLQQRRAAPVAQAPRSGFDEAKRRSATHQEGVTGVGPNEPDLNSSERSPESRPGQDLKGPDLGQRAADSGLDTDINWGRGQGRLADNLSQMFVDRSIAAEREAAAEIASLRQELIDMRKMFQQQWEGMGWHRFSEQNPVKADFWRRLSRIGMQSAAIKSLLDRMTDTQGAQAEKGTGELWTDVLYELVNSIPVVHQESILSGGIHAFVGPTGVGKTTTIGKLAARYVLAHGNQDVVLVSTDTYRIAAHDQLRAIGRILDVPVKIADTPEHLPALLNSLRDKSLVLIDTAGLGTNLDKQSSQLEQLSALSARVKNWLLLSATAQYQVMEQTIDTYQKASISGCILTKVDEALSLGEAVSVLSEAAIPLAYVTDGQKIPDDLHLADPRQLVHEALQLVQPELEEEYLAVEFADLMAGYKGYNRANMNSIRQNVA